MGLIRRHIVSLRRILPILAMVLPIFVGALRADENTPFSPDYLNRVWNDALELPTLPFHFDGKEWAITGGITAATVVALTADGEIREYFDKHRNNFSDSLSRYTTHFGDYHYQLPIQVGAWALGSAFGYAPLKKSAADGMEASLLAAGIVTPLFTRISGRELPSSHRRPLLFQPFKRGHPGRESFPSGHTTEAFAVATVFDVNFREEFGYWQTPFLYALAASTGASRIYDQKHFLSDVILGAGIGWSIGRWISDKPRNASAPRFSLAPSLNGIVVSWTF